MGNKDQGRYAALGVSASKTGIHKALGAIGAKPGHEHFAKVCQDASGSEDHYSFLHCDGAGTKSIVPYLIFKESGDPLAFAALAQDALVMNLDDVFCLGVPNGLLLANQLSRNPLFIPDDAISAVVGEYSRLCSVFKQFGISIELAGGETADCPDLVRTLIVDAVLYGRIKRSETISFDRVRAGDVIIGISSTGKAVYETVPNSGIGSNGLTLARHALLNRKYLEKYPESGEPRLDTEQCYRGPFSLSDSPSGLMMTIGQALSSPTRSYSPILVEIYRKFGSDIHGVIHNTGGGQTKVVRFGQGLIYIKDNLLPVPPLFSLIMEKGEVSPREMYKVFNMGHRLELYLPKIIARQAIDIIEKFGLQAQIVGYVKEQMGQESNTVIISSELGEYTYSLSDY